MGHLESWISSFQLGEKFEASSEKISLVLETAMLMVTIIFGFLDFVILFISMIYPSHMFRLEIRAKQFQNLRVGRQILIFFH